MPRSTKLVAFLTAGVLAAGVGGLGTQAQLAAAAPSESVTTQASKNKATLSFGLAPIAQSRSGTVNLTPGVASFSPVRKGKTVRIQRRATSGTWKTVASGKQNSKGKFSFQVAAGPQTKPYTFRALTIPKKNAKPIYSKAVRAVQYRKVWVDEFGGTTLGPAWRFRDSRAANRACSLPDPRMTSVSNGTLKVSVARNAAKSPNVTQACPNGQYLNGMIGTQGLKSFRYGIFAARIRYEAPQGGHGSFWMQTAGKAAGAQPGDAATNGTEIDITEYFGNGYSKGGLASFVYWPRKNSNGQVEYVKTGGLLPKAPAIFAKNSGPSQKYHVYSVEWTPTQYIFRIDGVETSRIKVGVSRVPEYLILSLLSSNYELPKITSTSLPMSMNVDWVRVWQK